MISVQLGSNLVHEIGANVRIIGKLTEKFIECRFCLSRKRRVVRGGTLNIGKGRITRREIDTVLFIVMQAQVISLALFTSLLIWCFTCYVEVYRLTDYWGIR